MRLVSGLSVSLLFANGCTGSPSGSSSTSTELPDAAIVSATCPSEGLELSGAYSFHTLSAATVTVQGRVAGIGGFDVGATGSYTLAAESVAAEDLDGVGVHDVATTHVRFLQGAHDADCTQAGHCAGFIARAGTFEVSSMSPYRATFQLEDLVTYDGSVATGGAALAGTVSGCLHAAP